MHEVFGSNAEAPRSHLFHLVTCLRLATIQLRVFSTLAGVAARSHVVHRQSNRPMGLGADRAQRHGLRAQSPQNRGLRLHFAEIRFGAFGSGDKLEQVAQCDRFAGPAQLGIGVEPVLLLGWLGLDEAMHRADQLRRISMAFSILAESKISAVAQCRSRSRSLVECAHMIHERVFQHLRKALPGKNKRGIAKELLVDFTVESNHFE